MATTSNFSWPTPDDDDLVRDGASAMRALGNAIDTTVAAGYRYAGTRYYTSSGTFAKADPLGTGDIGLRAIRVRVQGGGGGGGSTDRCDGTDEAAASPGGGAGAYAESFITDIAGLAASVTVTRGAGGAGGTAGLIAGPVDGEAGGTGGTSSFGLGEAYEVSAAGGDGGVRGFDAAVFASNTGAGGGTTATGDLVVPGARSAGSHQFGGSVVANSRLAVPTNGADSLFGAGGSSRATTDGPFDGVGASGYGAGGGGGASAKDATNQDGGAGGNGSSGIVIIDCFV